MKSPFSDVRTAALRSSSNTTVFGILFVLLIGINTLFALPFTLFQYLSLQYRTTHNEELRYIVQQYSDPNTGASSIEYGYHATPWDLMMNSSTVLFLLAPLFSTIILSLIRAQTVQGTQAERLVSALRLAAMILPILYLTNLPWALIYWDGWEWSFGLTLLSFYGLFIILCSGIVNKIYLATRKNESTITS